MPQLEFRWASWLSVLKSPPPLPAKPVKEDGGLTAWCAEASYGLGLPELARKVRVSWRTLKHELAHLVAYERCGRRRIDPHGDEWRAACAELGIPNEQPFHTLPFKRRRMKRNHAYICPNCFSTILRVKPIQRTVACYDCCRKFNRGIYHDRYRLIKHDPV
jgi:hypothetical protein